MISTLVANIVKRKVLAVQEFTHLLVSSLRRALTPPRYLVDTLIQMDVIGVGSLPIVLLTGFFTGGVLALQTYRTLSSFGEVGILGTSGRAVRGARAGSRTDSAHGGWAQQFRNCL